MFLLWIAITIWVSIIVHELGHYIAAKSMGMIISHVEIGSGKLRVRFTAFHDNWRIYSWPTRAFVALYTSSNQRKNLIAFSAGPAASFSMAIALWLSGQAVLSLIPLFDGVINSIPFKTKLFNSDGYNIRKAWRRRNEQPYPKYLHS